MADFLPLTRAVDRQAPRPDPNCASAQTMREKKRPFSFLLSLQSSACYSRCWHSSQCTPSSTYFSTQRRCNHVGVCSRFGRCLFGVEPCLPRAQLQAYFIDGCSAYMTAHRSYEHPVPSYRASPFQDLGFPTRMAHTELHLVPAARMVFSRQSRHTCAIWSDLRIRHAKGCPCLHFRRRCHRGYLPEKIGFQKTDRKL
jgi:hypothetical protein